MPSSSPIITFASDDDQRLSIASRPVDEMDMGFRSTTSSNNSSDSECETPLSSSPTKSKIVIPLHQNNAIRALVDTNEMMTNVRKVPCFTLPPIEQPSTLEGYLWKQGHSWKSWKRRFFRLEGRCLCYYSAKRQNELRGFIDLNAVSNVSSGVKLSRKGFGLQLCTPNRDYNIVAETETQANYWVNGLKMAKRRASLTTPSDSPSSSSSSSSVLTSGSLLDFEQKYSQFTPEEMIHLAKSLQKDLILSTQLLEEKENEVRMWKSTADKYETMAMVLSK
jgi:hypothetical protein